MVAISEQASTALQSLADKEQKPLLVLRVVMAGYG